MIEENILSNFGRNLGLLRGQQGLSQERLAELAQLDRTYVSSVERGRRNLSLINICKLAAALNCSPEALLHGLEGQL